jgi:hypothetical protein
VNGDASINTYWSWDFLPRAYGRREKSDFRDDIARLCEKMKKNIALYDIS